MSINPTTIQGTPHTYQLNTAILVTRMSINSVRQRRLPRMSTKSTAIQDTVHTPTSSAEIQV